MFRPLYVHGPLGAFTDELLCCQTLFRARSWMYTKCLRLRELEPFEKFKWHFNYSATTGQNITDYYEDVM